MNKSCNLSKVLPVFPLPKTAYFQQLWCGIETLVEQVFSVLEGSIAEIDESLPLVTWFPLTSVPAILPIVLLTRSHERFSNGTGRYFIDAINRYALPGHFLSVEASTTVDFYLSDRPEVKYGLSHIGVLIKTAEEWTALQKNLPQLAEEIRITVRAVHEARRIVSIKQLKEAEKALLLREQLTSLWKRDCREFELNLFDQVQHWLTKAKAEDQKARIWKEILPHVGNEEKIFFDRDMFVEIQALLLVYTDRFIAARRLKDLARLVCYQYFSKKKLQHDLEKEAFKRHSYLKIYKTGYQTEGMRTLGISIGLNLLNRYELLDVNHILTSVQTFVPSLQLVPDSYLSDARHETMRFYYLEVHKEDQSQISEQEFILLKSRLTQELEERIENVHHPLFEPTNEEELLKYVAILSQELNKEDLPQVVITFDRQAQDVFSFHIIILRHVHPDSTPVRELLEKVSPPYRWLEERVKRIKSPHGDCCKEATIIKAIFPKMVFFRKDFALDLGKARTSLSGILEQAIGEFRDYNGGTFEVQQRSFSSFKEGFVESEELLLERFFYGIEPTFMQRVLDSELLKEGYALLKQVVRKEFEVLPFAVLDSLHKQGVIVAIASPFLKSTDDLFQHMFSLRHRFPSLAFCSLWIGNIFALVLFYSTPDTCQQHDYLSTVGEMIAESFKLSETDRVKGQELLQLRSVE